MPGRNQSSESYRYGFQGQENDNEIKGNGNSVNYKYRMHDPRLGRFFAVDPLAPKYPHLTPYQFSSNRPIWGREIEGLENENEEELAPNSENDPNKKSSDPLRKYEFVNDERKETEPKSTLDNNQTTEFPNNSEEFISEAKKVLAKAALDKIFSYTLNPTFGDNFGITYDEEGQDKLASFMIGQELSGYSELYERIISGRIVRVATARGRSSLIDFDNTYGHLKDSWKLHQTSDEDEYFPTNPVLVTNPGWEFTGQNVLPRIFFGHGDFVYMSYSFQVLIEEEQ